jgi:hypothetical protein
MAVVRGVGPDAELVVAVPLEPPRSAGNGDGRISLTLLLRTSTR